MYEQNSAMQTFELKKIILSLVKNENSLEIEVSKIPPVRVWLRNNS